MLTRTTPSAACGPGSRSCARFATCPCRTTRLKDTARRSRRIHHGPLYVDFDEDDVYGLAANVGARLQAIAAPGTVVVSDEVRQLVEDRFEIEAGDPQIVKGVPDPLQPFRVLGERAVPVKRSWSTPLLERGGALERLRHVWAEVADGTADHASGVLVYGDTGVGKSRLVAAFVDELRSAGTCVVELHGSPFHVDAGLHPVRNLLEARCDITDDTDPGERLERLAGEVRNLGLDRSQSLPLLATVWRSLPAPGMTRSPRRAQLEEQVAEAAQAYIRACMRDSRRSSWPRTSTGSTARLASCSRG